MNALPFDVRRYLYKQWNKKNIFGYILIGKLDFSIEWSENLSSLYGINLIQNQPADEQLLFLQGIYPYEKNEPLILEEVNFPTNRAADIHIVPSRYNVCILLFDVTDKVLLHQELQQKRNEIKLLYEQEMRSMRILKQSYEELKRQKELAENANRIKSEFLQQITRDLKSPLNGILGFAQLLESPLVGDAFEYVQEIKNSGANLLAMINELLNVSEGESIKLNPERVSVSNLIQESIDAFKPIAEEKNVDFIIRLNKDLPSILIDRLYLQQIINALLSNAIQYNKENGCIIISAYITCNQSIHINIKDTGTGIGAETLTTLFQPCKQDVVENPKTGQSETSLSFCKQLTELMQGAIGVYSDVGVGSLFWLNFPLDNEQQIAKKPQKQTILYIEDNQAYLFLMNCFIEQYQGCCLLNAKNVPDIFELINNHPISVIFLDTDTFASDYLDIFQALQVYDKSKNIPVIALFNEDIEPGQIKAALNAGFYDYISKPFDFNQAMEIFDRLAAVQ